MYTRTFHRAVLALILSAAVVAAQVAVPANAGPAEAPQSGAATAAGSGQVSSITDALARRVATAFADRALADRLVARALGGPVELAAATTGSLLSGAVRTADQAVLAAKGLPATAGSLLLLRLAHPSMRAALTRGEAPLVAATPTDDTASSLYAYDSAGRQLILDVAKLPAQPVLLVEVDTAKALPMGLALVRDRLAARGIADVAGSTQATATATAGYWATKVTAVRLANDQEPWIKGAAEIYSVVAGFGTDGKAKVDLVQMPYLDNDGQTYYPNQLLVHYSAYKYNLADVVMMEDDGDTNYQALAQAIATALLTVLDLGVYAPLVDAILAAIPTSWYTDDPDYVDSWYTLSTGSTGRLNGAAGNGWLDVVPYFVQPL